MKSDWSDRIFSIVLLVIGLAAVGILIWSVVLLIQGPWYGSGTVVEKDHRSSYISYCGKGCFVTVPECYSLKVIEGNGNEHNGCVTRGLWDEAAIGRHISITPQHH